ncbi:hypothetical protein ACHAXR_010344 [Thalassiosira sp. AJA248-18]
MSSPADKVTPRSPQKEGDNEMPMNSDSGADRVGTSPDEVVENSDHVASQSPSQTLHDLLSSGEIESALSSLSKFTPGGEGLPSSSTTDNGLGIRLPLLLRLLCRASAAISPPSLDEISSSHKSSGSTLPDINAIVPLLEDVAAAHPDAENVEVLVSALAPSICKDAIGKLAPLSRMKVMNNLFSLEHHTMGASSRADNNCAVWNTKNLDIALQRLANPTSATQQQNSRKRQNDQQEPGEGKRQKLDNNTDPLLEKMMMVIDILEQDDGSDEQDDVHVKHQNEEVDSPSTFFAQASSDSHESAVRRVLQELISLVKSSLRTQNNGISSSSGDDGGVEVRVTDEGRASSLQASSGFLTPGLTLKSDSLFAETDEVSSFIGGGWSRLSVMIPVLMQHAPILRYEHVANALCRAAVPQAPALIKVMAANSSGTATQSLLRGCVTAYQLAVKFECSVLDNAAKSHGEEVDMHVSNSSEIKDIIRTTVESAKCLASLSRREALTVIRILKDQQRVMDGLVLSLLIDNDAVCAASFIVEKLSSGPTPFAQTSNSAHHEVSDVKEPKMKRVLPLRQRMIGVQASVGRVLVPAETVPSRLFKELVEDKSLAENVRHFISQRIILLLKTKKGMEGTRFGEASLLIQAYALVVHSLGIGAGSSAGSGSKFVEDTMMAIRQLSDDKSSVQDLPTQSPKDNVYKTAICAAIITCSKYPPIGDSQGFVIGGQAVKACLDCLQGLLLQPTSVESSIFSSRFAGFIIDNDAQSLRNVSLETIIAHTCSSDNEKDQISQTSNVCRWLSSDLVRTGKLKSIHKKGLGFNCLIHDPIVAVEAVRRSNSQRANDLDDLMKNIFADPTLCEKMIQHPRTCSLIQESVKMLVERPAPHIPIVLPLSLERLAQSLPWAEIGAGVRSKSTMPQFVLQLFYALDFLDHQPQSPFVISSRLFPVRESIAYLDSCHENSTHGKDSGLDTLNKALRKLVRFRCPDILQSMINHSHLSREHDGLMVNHRQIIKPMMVYEAIRDCLNGDTSMDLSGLRAEKMFMLCRSTYPSLEVDVAAVGAILATDNSQPKFYSYVALAKDPLVLFKAPAAAFSSRGLRCIILRVLLALMNANECISMQSSVAESVALEYLATRDTIIVRCIIFACASGFVFCGRKIDTPRTRHCMMSVNMIRCIISKRRGIIATLIKQDLPENCINWIIEFVPESLSDGPIILSLLSENGLLSPTERLLIASVGLQIAVAHSHRGEAIVKKLVTASTAVLLDSFTLVIGPIGVPVSILREENGRDVTNICREKMFRMIKTLASISPKDTDLKNEASVILSKIAALCKSENAVRGVSGAAASRRKLLLKEIWEACLQANTALGAAMQI